jgi:hypothetical protein
MEDSLPASFFAGRGRGRGREREKREKVMTGVDWELLGLRGGWMREEEEIGMRHENGNRDRREVQGSKNKNGSCTKQSSGG